MLSTQPIKNTAQASHYFLGHDNYYTEENTLGKERSQWWGIGAQELNLSGAVDAELFTQLLRGTLPDCQQLGKQEGDKIHHRPGVDLTFSAPKSVSILALMGGDERIFKAIERATDQALTMIERDLAKARVTRLGNTHYVKTGNLVVARFLHDLSREGDPQLHTHCVVMNMTQRSDGRWRSLASQMGNYGEQVKQTPDGFLEAVRHHKKYYGGIFRAELAYEMTQLGYQVVKDKNGFFEIAGISPQVIKAYSQRREDIKAFMQENHLVGAKAAAMATLQTRQAKKQVNREDLITNWKAKAELFEVPVFDQAREIVAKSLQSHAEISSDAMQTVLASNGLVNSTGSQASEQSVHKPFPNPYHTSTQNVSMGTAEKIPGGLTAQQAVLDAMAHLSETRIALSETDLIHQASQYILGEPVSVTTLLQAVEGLKATGELIPLPAPAEFRDEAHFTTATLLQYEKELLQVAAKPHASGQSIVAASPLKAFLNLQTGLTQEQRQALLILFSNEQQLLALEGSTGSGKTHLLKPMMELAKLGGYQPLVLTPSKAHSIDLERQLKSVPANLQEWFKSLLVGKQCDTVAGFLFRQENKSPLEMKLQEKLQRKPLIFVENATLLSLRQSRDLTHHIERLGGRLIVIGDAKSTLSWQASNPFHLLLQHGITVSHLIKDQRVVSESLKTAVVDTLQGQIQAAFEKVGHHIFSIKDKDERLEVMAAHYVGLPANERRNACVLMPTKTACGEINLIIREQLKKNGEISGFDTMIKVLLPNAMTAVEQHYAKNYKVDQWVRFNKDYFSLRITQGDYRRITGVDAERNIVLLADAAGRIRPWNPAQVAVGKTEVFETKDRAVAVGDTLVWQRNDKVQGLYNGMHVMVRDVTDRYLKLMLENNKTVALDYRQPSFTHFDYGHAFTANQRYYTRPDIVIAYQSSTSRQSHQRSFYQLIAQAKQQAWIYTEDQTRLLYNLQQHTGDKATAIGMLLQEVATYSASDTGQFNSAHFKLLEIAVQQALNKLQQAPIVVAPENTAIEAVRYAMAHLAEREAAFTHKQVVDTALRHVLGEVSTKHIDQAIKQAETAGQLIRGLYSVDGTSWTTQEALKQEQAIITLAKMDKGQLPPLLNADTVTTYRQAQALSQEQGDALSKLALVTDRIVLIQGFAGTRKTTLLQHVQTLMQSQNHHLLCLAPTHVAVKELRARGLEGQTVDHFLAQCRIGKVSAPTKPLLIAVDESSMVSNRRLHEFLKAIHSLDARAQIIGDTYQYASIESGKPFALLQKAGVHTLFLKDITRQQDEALKAAVKAVYQNEFAKTFHILENNIVEIGSQKVDNKIIDNRGQRLEAIRDDYLARDLTRRAQTVIITLGNEDRILLNALIREGLKAEGELVGDTRVSRVLVASNMTEIERTRASNYQLGEMVRFNLSERRFGIEKGQYWLVEEILTKQNSLVLTRGGEKKIWKPRSLTTDRKTVGVEVYRAEERELQAGDLIRWTRTDKALGLLSPELAKVEEVKDKQVRVRPVALSDKGLTFNDTPIQINPQEARFQHWDHAYAVTGYSSQGKTILEVILHAESFRKWLANQRSLLVMITRAVKKLTLYTDNKEALLGAIKQNTGEKTSALETVGAFPYERWQLSDSVKSPMSLPPENQKTAQSTFSLHPAPAKSSLPGSTREVANRDINDVSKSSIRLSPIATPRPSLLDSQRIYHRLLADAEHVVERLLGEPKVKEAGQYRYGSHQGSLVVTLNGDKRGLWHDFQTGEGGNLFRLIAKQNDLDMKRDFRQVLQESLHLLGTSEADLTVMKDSLTPTVSVSKNKAKTLTSQQQKSVRYARQLARESQPLAGTLAERYLREHRHILMDQFPAGLRFHPGIYSKRNEAIHPALLVIAKDEQQKVQAVQAIFLDEKTAQKADIAVKKQTWGIPSQCAVKLAKLTSTLTHSFAPTYLAEGAETALSIYAAIGGDVRITLGKSNFKNIDSKAAGKHIVLCLDNDGHRPEGDKLIQFVAENLLKQGKQVWVAKPIEAGQDYNDVLKNQGLPAVKKAMEQAIPYADYKEQKTPTVTLQSAILDQQDSLRSELKLLESYNKPIQIEAKQIVVNQHLAKNLTERPLIPLGETLSQPANKNSKLTSESTKNNQSFTPSSSEKNHIKLVEKTEKTREPEL